MPPPSVASPSCIVSPVNCTDAPGSTTNTLVLPLPVIVTRLAPSMVMLLLSESVASVVIVTVVISGPNSMTSPANVETMA